MKIEKIFFEQLFPTGNFANQRLGVEGTPSEGELYENAFAHAKSVVEAAFQKLNPGASPTPSITDYNTGERIGDWETKYGVSVSALDPRFQKTPRSVINREAERVAILIENATDEADLNAVWEKAGEHQLMVEWEKKSKELSK